MGKRIQSLRALCPFYKSEDSQRICCEGLLPRSSIHVAFADSNDRREFGRTHCKSWDYEACPLCQMHMKRYQEAGE